MADDGWEVASGGDGWEVADGWEPASPPRDIRGLAKKRLEALTGGASEDAAPAPAAPGDKESASPVTAQPARPRPVPKPEPEGPSALDAVLTPELQAARKRFAAARLSASNAPNQPADDSERRLRAGGLDVFASPKPPDAPYDPRQEGVHRVGDFLTAAGAAARAAIGGFGDISPDATPIQRARLRRPEGLNLAGGGVRKYEPPRKDEPYLPAGAGVVPYRPVADRAVERLAALQRGDDGTIRREGAQPLFAGKALGEAPATTRLNPEDTLRAKLEGTAPVQTLENDYTKAHDWMQGASDDFGHWLTEDTQHSALARLIDAGENSDSAMAQVVAAGTKGIAQAGASSAPALAEFALLHRATPGALKPLADAAMASYFGGEGAGQALEALPHAASDIGSAIGGAPAPFDEMAQHLGQLGMGTFMAATPFGAKQHIAEGLREQADLGRQLPGYADREMAARANSVEEMNPMIGALQRQPGTAPLTDFLFNRGESGKQPEGTSFLDRPKMRGGPWQNGLADLFPGAADAGEAQFNPDYVRMAESHGPPISPYTNPRRGEYSDQMPPPSARGTGIYARDVPIPPGEVPPRPGQPTPEQLKAMLDSILGPSVEGTRQGPFPVPPDISQGRTLPPGPPLPEGATWQERQEAARREPAPPEPPTPPPPPPSMPPRYAPPEIPPDATWQRAQAAERGRRANPLEDPAKLKEILSNLLGPEGPQELEARTGRTPPAAEKIQPEPQATLDAQMQALVEGRKPAVLFPRQGEHAVPETPEGFVRVDTPAGAVIFDPNKVDAAAVAKAADSGKGLGKILGMGVDERPEGGTIVTARTPEGTEVQSAQATPEQVPAAVEAARKVAGPEGKVTEGTTEQIVAERQAGLESEKGDIALRVAKAVYGPNAQPASVEFVRRVLGGDVPPKAAPKVVERIRAEAAKGIAPPAPASAIHPAIQGAVEAKRHAGSNIEAAGDARVVRLNGPDGSSFVIHESPSEPGKWQVTRFEGDAPTGHVVFGSREDAIRSASGQRVNQQAPVGDRRYVVEPGKAEAPPRIQIEPGRTSDLGGEEERDAVQPPGGREEVRSAPEGAGAPDVPAGEPGAGEGRTPSGEESRGTAGRRATIWVKPDQPIEVEHRIVEAGDVVPSHDAEGRIDPRYPTREGLQPRDRSRDESVRQITTMARNLNPALLGESLDATTGAPVVTDAPKGGLHPVESGNGRAAAIREAYRTGRAGAYRERLEADAERYGMTPEEVAKMREPMLVRSRVTELSPEEQRQFTRDANASAALRMGAAEQATSDAAAMTPEILADFLPSEDGDVLAASNRRFLRRFFDEVVPETDRGELIDANGNPNLRAVQRIKAAIMGKAYGQDRLLARALEAADDNTRTVSAGLLAAAPRVAKVRAAIEAGDLHPVDFLAPIKEAVDHLYSAKDMKLSVPDYMAQRDMFAWEMSPEGSELLAFMDRNKRSAKKIGGMVDSIARAVEGAGHPGQTDLFGGEADAPRTAEIYSAAKRIYEARHEDVTSAQAGLFDQAGSGGPDRGESPGAGPAGGGGASGGGGGGEPGGGGPGVYGSPAGRPTGRSLVRSRGGLGGTPESEPVRPGGARSAAVRPDVERYDSPSDAPRPATMAGPGTKAETNPREIVKELETVSGTPIRYGHGYFAPRRAMGWFDPRNNAIRLRTAEDIVTAAHEVGHSIHKFVLQDRQGFPRPVATELDRLGRDLYGSRVPNGGYIREGMAEYVAKYLIGDDMTKDAPELHKWLRANMTPEKLKGLDAARDLYRKWDEAGAVGRVMGKIHTVEAGPVAQLKDGWEKLTHFFSRQMWTNKFAPLDDVVAEIKKQHGLSDLEPTKNPAVMAAALEKNAPGTARSFIFNAAVDTKGDVVGGSLADALKEIPHKELPELMAYSYARRAVDLWERDINPGITLADAKATVAQLESPQRRAALDGMTTWSNHLLDYVVKSGGLTATEAKLIRDANPVYVPLKRYFDEVERGGGGVARSGFVNQGKAVQKIRGSGRSVINPIDSFIRQADSMIRLGNKLRVGRSIVDLANEKPGLAWFAQKVEDPKESTTFSVRDLKRQLEKAGADLSSADLDATMSVFQNAGEYRGRQNIVSIVRNGQREFWELDPDVYRVVTHMDHEALPTYLSALAAPKRMVQLGATGVNAGFSLIANPIRDAFTWAVYSKGQHLTPAEAFKGLWSGLSKSPEAQRWKALGGELSTLMGQDRIAAGRAVEEALARTGKEKAWITLRHPIDALREHLGIFESGPRIAEFTRVLKDAEQKWGKGTENAYLEALLASKEATVNFTRAGVIGQALNQLVPFFNARIQGASKFYRTFGGPEGKSAALKATAQAVAWITVPSMALWYINKDEEWYKELKPWEKGAFWVWSTDHGKTKYRIPKPQELGYVFGSVPEAFADYAYRKNARGVSDAMWGTMDSLMPFGLSQGAAGVADVLPAAVKPLIEAGLNYDTFKNRPIVDPFLEKRKLPKDQYQKYTTEIAKQIGAWLNISPSKIDHTVSGYTGGLGLDVARGIELATGLRKGKDIEGLEDVPVIGRLGVRPSPGVSVDHMHEVDASLRQKVGSKVATEAEKVTLKRIASAKTAIDHARLAAEGAKGDDLHLLNSWSTHMAQWALGKREEMPYDEAESLEQKFPSDEWDKAFRAMNRKIPTYEAEAPPE